MAKTDEVLSLTDIFKEVTKKYGQDVMSIGVEDLTQYGTL